MLSTLITLCVVALVLGLIWWAVHRTGGALGAPGIILTILDVVLVLVFAYFVLQTFGLLGRLQ